jgi:hypothetical protein
VTLPDVVQTLVERQPPRVLHVAAVDDEAKRPHLSARRFFELDAPHRFQINRGDLLARAQIGDGLFPHRGGDAKSDAATHAAAIKP